jgi:hypothetical protein
VSKHPGGYNIDHQPTHAPDNSAHLGPVLGRTTPPEQVTVCETHDAPRSGVIGKIVDKVAGTRTETTCHQEWDYS